MLLAPPDGLAGSVGASSDSSRGLLGRVLADKNAMHALVVSFKGDIQFLFFFFLFFGISQNQPLHISQFHSLK